MAHPVVSWCWLAWPPPLVKALESRTAPVVVFAMVDHVTEWLEAWSSPDEIERRLRLEFP